MLPQKLAAMVDVQNDQRKRRALRSRAIGFDQQAIDVRAAAEQARSFRRQQQASEPASATACDSPKARVDRPRPAGKNSRWASTCCADESPTSRTPAMRARFFVRQHHGQAPIPGQVRAAGHAGGVSSIPPRRRAKLEDNRRRSREMRGATAGIPARNIRPSSGGVPAAPTATRQRATPRYLPTSAAVAERTSRGVGCRYISRLISAIGERSRWVSAAEKPIEAAQARPQRVERLAAGRRGDRRRRRGAARACAVRPWATSSRARKERASARSSLLRPEKVRRCARAAPWLWSAANTAGKFPLARSDPQGPAERALPPKPAPRPRRHRSPLPKIRAAASRNGRGLRRARKNILQESGVGFSLELRDALLVAIVVRIDVHEAVEYFAGFLHALGPQIKIEEVHERVEIFRFAIQLFVETRDGLGEGQRIRIELRPSRSICGTSSASLRAPRIHSLACASSETALASSPARR